MVVNLLIFKQIVSLIRSRSSNYRLVSKNRICAMTSSSDTSPLTVAKLAECNAEGIRTSGDVLKAGGLVAFPTETVYGLGANALNDLSVKSIFAAKKRPSTDPLIVHILGKGDIYDLYDFEDTKLGISKAQLVCEHLAESFWPGPLTIIFKARKSVPLSVTAGSGYVGLRSPKHPIARQLLAAAGLPIAAPSANRFGHVSPTSADHVMKDLGEEDVTILKDDISLSGGCSVGIESTVCRVSKSGDVVSILRCGAVTSEDILAALLKSNFAGLDNVTVVIENEKALIKSAASKTINSNIKAESNSEHDETAASSRHAGRRDEDLELQPLGDESSDAPSSSSSSSPSGTHINVKNAFIIDYNGQLKHFKEKASIYYDLSSDGVPEMACNKIFEVLRRAEDPSLAAPNGKGEGVKLVLLPDLRADAERSEMVRALWERLHRAASGTFVH
jgi:L-threonylcarbamoyladenylate synthase